MGVIASPPPLEAGYWALGLPTPTKAKLAEYKVAVWGEQPGFPVCAEVRAAIARVSATLEKHGAIVDASARPAGFDGEESHRLYLQLLGCTNTAKESWGAGRAWDQQHSRDAAAETTLAAVNGRLWEVADRDFVVQHSVTQSYCQYYAANERRTELRVEWAKFFRDGGFDAVLMPVYPVRACTARAKIALSNQESARGH